MVGVMKVMATSFKMTFAHTTVFSVLTPEQDTVNTRLCQRLLDTHTEVWLSLLWGHCSFLLGPGVHMGVCALQESVSPVLWKFCNKIPLASKVKIPGGSQSFCKITRLRNLLCVLELS